MCETIKIRIQQIVGIIDNYTKTSYEQYTNNIIRHITKEDQDKSQLQPLVCNINPFHIRVFNKPKGSGGVKDLSPLSYGYRRVLAQACGVPAVGVQAVDCWQ